MCCVFCLIFSFCIDLIGEVVGVSRFGGWEGFHYDVTFLTALRNIGHNDGYDSEEYDEHGVVMELCGGDEGSVDETIFFYIRNTRSF